MIKQEMEVQINKIEEPLSSLYHGETFVGIINSSLQLNDVLLQIFRNKLEGYSLLYEEEIFEILPTGRIKDGGKIYPLLSKQMKEIIGF